MVVMKYQLHECMKPCLMCDSHCLSFPIFIVPPSPPTQGDDPLNSADDDDDSDGEGAHFDTRTTLSASLRRYVALKRILW